MDQFLAAAYEEALKGLAEGGIPIGSVLVLDNTIIGRGHNRRIQESSPTLHAEIDAIENAGRLSGATYKKCTLYTTLSPCSMCSGAAILYGIPKIVIGENINFMGEEELLKLRHVDIQVVQSQECIDLMKNFIGEHPDLWFEDIGK